MTHRLDLESLDLSQLATVLRGACGPSVAGAVVGRTRLRDALCEHLRCSQLEGEMLVDTMVGRGFVVRREHGGLVEWVLESS